MAITFYDYKINPSIRIRNKLVEENINLARFVAHKVASKVPIPYEELEQIASMGLIVAVERYDPTIGAKFSTFAIPLITGRLLNFVRDSSNVIKLPRKYHEVLQKGKRTLKDLSISLGRTPTKSEFFQSLLTLGITQSEFSKAKKAYQDCRYIACYDTAISSVSDTFGSEVEPNHSYKVYELQTNESHLTNSLEKNELIDKVNNILTVDIADLSYQEAVIRLYFFEYFSFNKIARLLELSQEQIFEVVREWCQSL